MQTALKENKSELIYADNRAAVVGFVRQLIDEAQREYIVDRRHENRFPLSVLVNVVPLGENGWPLSSGFEAVTRDISALGISLLYTDPVEQKYLILRFPQASSNPPALVVEVLRRTTFGPFSIIACRFLPTLE